MGIAMAWSLTSEQHHHNNDMLTRQNQFCGTFFPACRCYLVLAPWLYTPQVTFWVPYLICAQCILFLHLRRLTRQSACLSCDLCISYSSLPLLSAHFCGPRNSLTYILFPTSLVKQPLLFIFLSS